MCVGRCDSPVVAHLLGGTSWACSPSATRYTFEPHECVSLDSVRTNIVIDDELLAEAQRLCGAATKRATVEFALQELVRRRERRKVLDLRGKVKWEGDLGNSRRSA